MPDIPRDYDAKPKVETGSGCMLCDLDGFPLVEGAEKVHYVTIQSTVGRAHKRIVCTRNS